MASRREAKVAIRDEVNPTPEEDMAKTRRKFESGSQMLWQKNCIPKGVLNISAIQHSR